MIKRTPKKSILSIEDAPIESPSERKFEKLGIIQPKQRFKNFKFKAETIEALEKLKEYLNEKTTIKINHTNIVEALIRDAAKRPSKVIKCFRGA